MHTIETETLTEEHGTDHLDPRTETTTIPATSDDSQPQPPTTADAPHTATNRRSVAVAFAAAAIFAVGALVWAVITGPSDTSFDTSTHDRVELNRTAALRDLAAQRTGFHDRVELNRTAALRDLAARPS